MNSSKRFIFAELDRQGDSFSAAASVRFAPDVASIIRRNGAGRVTSDFRVSTHEAGHAAAGIFLGIAVDGVKIGRTGGLTWADPGSHDNCRPLAEFSDAPLFELVPPPCLDDFTEEELTFVAELRVKMYARIIQALAGTAAERLFFPDVTPMVAATDLQKAAAWAKLIANDLKAAATLLDFARKDSARIVAAHRDQIAAIADVLIIERTLDGAAIGDILASMPPELRAERARRKEWAAMAANVERAGLRMMRLTL